MILGVTGFFCSGKDTVAAALERKGFAHCSLSQILRQELAQRRVEETIPNLTQIGNELRETFGAGVLAQRALDSIDYMRNWVITSIRHPAEVQALRMRPDFEMVFIDADQRLRYDRSMTRNRHGDPPTFESFVQEETRQASPENVYAQDLNGCKQLADHIIQNNASKEVFENELFEYVSKLLFTRFQPRPSWDEYFMMMAEVAALRSNCIKRHVGAVLVIDQQILSTGYNGTPRGIKNCNEGGCPRGAALTDSGAALSECIGVHAEENAIIQAAAHGVAIRGATLYCTLCPCMYCAKSIINAGIKEVVYRESYAMDTATRELLTTAHVRFRHLKEPRVSITPRYRQQKFNAKNF